MKNRSSVLFLFLLVGSFFLTAGQTAFVRGEVVVGGSSLITGLPLFSDDFLNINFWQGDGRRYLDNGRLTISAENASMYIDLASIFGNPQYVTTLGDNFVIQFDAVMSNDRTDLMIGSNIHAHDADDGFALFIRAWGGLSIYSGNDITVIDGGGMAMAGELHNLAIHFDRPNDTITYYLDEMLVGAIDLGDLNLGNGRTIATDSGFNPSRIGLSYGGSQIYVDNFQIGTFGSTDWIESDKSDYWNVPDSWLPETGDTAGKAVRILSGHEITVSADASVKQVDLGGNLVIQQDKTLDVANQVVLRAGSQMDVFGTLSATMVSAYGGVTNLAGRVELTGGSLLPSSFGTVNIPAGATSAAIDQAGGNLTVNTLNLGEGAAFTGSGNGLFVATNVTLDKDSKFFRSANGDISVKSLDMGENSLFDKTGSGTMTVSTLTMNAPDARFQDFTGHGNWNIGTLEMASGAEIDKRSGGSVTLGTANMSGTSSFYKNNSETLNVTSSLTLNDGAAFTNEGSGAITINTLTLNDAAGFIQNGSGRTVIQTLNYNEGSRLLSNTGSVVVNYLTMPAGDTFTKEGGNAMLIRNTDGLAGNNAFTVKDGTLDFGANVSFANVSSLNLEGGKTIIGGSVTVADPGLKHWRFAGQDGYNLNLDNYIGNFYSGWNDSGTWIDYDDYNGTYTPLAANGTDVIITPYINAINAADPGRVVVTQENVVAPGGGGLWFRDDTNFYAESWAGFFTPATTGTYHFWAWNDDQTKIWIDLNQDGKFTSDDVVLAIGVDERFNNWTFELEQGKTYAVAIAFSQSQGAGYHDYKLLDPYGNFASILAADDFSGVWSTTNNVTLGQKDLSGTMVNVSGNSILQMDVVNGSQVGGIHFEDSAALTLRGIADEISVGTLSSAAGKAGALDFTGGKLTVTDGISVGGGLNITGDLEMAAGTTLTIDLFDGILNVIGDFRTDGNNWTLELNYLGDGEIIPTDQFILAAVDFENYEYLVGLNPSLELSANLLDAGFSLGWNAADQLVLSGIRTQEESVTPEPAAWGLMALGLLAGAGILRKRRR